MGYALDQPRFCLPVYLTQILMFFEPYNRGSTHGEQNPTAQCLATPAGASIWAFPLDRRCRAAYDVP